MLNTQPATPDAFAFVDKTGRRHVLDVPPAAAATPSFFVFSLHKAGSTMLTGIMNDLCPQAGVAPINLMGALFKSSVFDPDIPHAVGEVFRPAGYCYQGFRYLPWQFPIPDLAARKKVLLVRDPRDILVSLYYSIIKSHDVPKTEGKLKTHILNLREKSNMMSIDDFALERAPYFAKVFGSYEDIVDDNLRLYRYEDVVYKKFHWIRDLVRHVGLDVSEEACRTAVVKRNVFPEAERADQHVRQVHPGNHKTKLRPETIAALDELFAPVLTRHGYA